MSELPKIGIGYRVGMLEVVDPTAERKSGYTVWRCRCACGGEERFADCIEKYYTDRKTEA